MDIYSTPVWPTALETVLMLTSDTTLQLEVSKLHKEVSDIWWQDVLEYIWKTMEPYLSGNVRMIKVLSKTHVL